MMKNYAFPDPLGTAGEAFPESLKFVVFLGDAARYNNNLFVIHDVDNYCHPL